MNVQINTADKSVKEFVENGKLVPDELVINIIKNFTKSGSAKDGFLLDGFPRNLAPGTLEARGLNGIRRTLPRRCPQ